MSSDSLPRPPRSPTIFIIGLAATLAASYAGWAYVGGWQPFETANGLREQILATTFATRRDRVEGWIATVQRDRSPATLERLLAETAQHLADEPTDGGAWYVRAVLLNLRRGPQAALDALRQSYSTAPYEKWIADRRVFLGLLIWQNLPEDMRFSAREDMFSLATVGRGDKDPQLLARAAWEAGRQQIEVAREVARRGQPYALGFYTAEIDRLTGRKAP